MHLSVQCCPSASFMLMMVWQLKLGSWTYDGFHLNLTEYTPGEGLHLGDMNKNSRYLITSQQPDPIKACRLPYTKPQATKTTCKGHSCV